MCGLFLPERSLACSWLLGINYMLEYRGYLLIGESHVTTTLDSLLLPFCDFILDRFKEGFCRVLCHKVGCLIFSYANARLCKSKLQLQSQEVEDLFLQLHIHSPQSLQSLLCNAHMVKVLFVFFCRSGSPDLEHAANLLCDLLLH